MTAIIEQTPAPWMRRVCLDGFNDWLHRVLKWYPYGVALDQVASILRELPEGDEIAARHLDGFKRVARNFADSESNPHLDQLIQMGTTQAQ